MKLLIIGAGTFSTEVEEMARLLGYDEIAFVDDNPKKAVAGPVIGTTDDINMLRATFDNAIVAIGNNQNRMKYHKLLEEAAYVIPTLIHPMAYVSPDAVISAGCIVRAFAVVGRYAELGKATILNLGAKVDHHCRIGEGSHLLINSVVRGSRKVEAGSWIKAGEVVEDIEVV